MTFTIYLLTTMLSKVGWDRYKVESAFPTAIDICHRSRARKNLNYRGKRFQRASTCFLK